MTATAIGSYATAAAVEDMLGQNLAAGDLTLLGLICDRVNQYIESFCRTPLTPISSTTYLYDGNGLRRIFLPLPLDEPTLGIGGARAVTLVEIANGTGEDFATVDSTDYFLRQRHTVNGPYRWLVLADTRTGSHSTFPLGMANVRVTMTAGWAAIPDDVTELAINMAHRAWNARESGQQNIVGSDESGQSSVAQYVSGRDRKTLLRYRMESPV